MSEFPNPRVDSLPEEPLKAGEQYFLDLAGNIKKGPVGHGSTCYCAPFIHRYHQVFFIEDTKSTKSLRGVFTHWTRSKIMNLLNKLGFLPIDAKNFAS